MKHGLLSTTYCKISLNETVVIFSSLIKRIKTNLVISGFIKSLSFSMMFDKNINKKS